MIADRHVHAQRAGLPVKLGQPEERREQLWRRYREEAEGAVRSGLFDVLSHPDRPKRSIGAPPPGLYDAPSDAHERREVPFA